LVAAAIDLALRRRVDVVRPHGRRRAPLALDALALETLAALHGLAALEGLAAHHVLAALDDGRLPVRVDVGVVDVDVDVTLVAPDVVGLVRVRERTPPRARVD